MVQFKEYRDYDLLGLKTLADTKEVKVQEILEAAIYYIDQLNTGLNAVINDLSHTVSQQLESAAPTAPLYGMPFLLKDLGAVYKGQVLSNGSRLFRNYIPDYNSTLVDRYLQAGLMVLGKTNTPEFGLKGTTEPAFFGRTRNPWNPQKTTGGSSGGSAAAVASGMVPVASGGDGGGSIRIPASYCGLFGLKPGRGRMPTGPKAGDLWQGATTQHVLTRTVRDSAFLLDLTHGMDKGSRNYATPYTGSFLKAIDSPLKPLKIAFNIDSPIGMGVDQDHQKAVLNTVNLLSSLGHEVIEAKPPVDGIRLAKSYLTMYMGEVHASMLEAADLLQTKIRKSDVEADTWLLAKLGEITSAGEFVRAIQFWDELARVMQAFFDEYDLYLTPTTAFPAANIGELDMPQSQKMLINLLTATGGTKLLKASGQHMEIALKNLRYTPFTQIANLSGLPAMSVPAGMTREGMPIGVQFIGPYCDEELLLKMARQIELAQPWPLLAKLQA